MHADPEAAGPFRCEGRQRIRFADLLPPVGLKCGEAAPVGVPHRDIRGEMALRGLGAWTPGGGAADGLNRLTHRTSAPSISLGSLGVWRVQHHCTTPDHGGIGAATAHRFVSEGADVVVIGRTKEQFDAEAPAGAQSADSLTSAMSSSQGTV